MILLGFTQALTLNLSKSKLRSLLTLTYLLLPSKFKPLLTIPSTEVAPVILPLLPFPLKSLAVPSSKVYCKTVPVYKVSSIKPSQSSSRPLSKISVTGVTSPMQLPHKPLEQICIPVLHSPILLPQLCVLLSVHQQLGSLLSIRLSQSSSTLPVHNSLALGFILTLLSLQSLPKAQLVPYKSPSLSIQTGDEIEPISVNHSSLLLKGAILVSFVYPSPL